MDIVQFLVQVEHLAQQVVIICIVHHKMRMFPPCFIRKLLLHSLFDLSRIGAQPSRSSGQTHSLRSLDDCNRVALFVPPSFD